MRTKKRLVLALSLILLVVMAMPLTASAIDWKQAEGETINLLMNKHTYTNSLQAIVGDFEKLSGIKVNIYALSEQQFWEKQRIVLTTESDEYDITMTGPLFIWMYNEFLEPLNKYMEDPKLTDIEGWNKGDFYQGLMESNAQDGKQYVIPTMVEGYILHYRKDIFDQFGLTVPKTMEEYVEVAKKLREELKKAGMEGIEPAAIRGVKGTGTVHVGYMNIFNSYGAKDFDENGKCAINSPEGVKATDLYVQLIKAGTSPDWTSYDWYDVKDAMSAGKAVMSHDCNFFAAEQHNPKTSNVVGKMAYAQVPSGPKSNVSNIWTWGLCMNAASSKKKAAWLFIQWATSREALLNAAVNFNNFDPTRKSVWNDPQVAAMLKDMGNYREVDSAMLETARVLESPNPDILTFLTMWSEAIQEIWMGKDTKEALDDLCKRVDSMDMLEQ